MATPTIMDEFRAFRKELDRLCEATTDDNEREYMMRNLGQVVKKLALKSRRGNGLSRMIQENSLLVRELRT